MAKSKKKQTQVIESDVTELDNIVHIDVDNIIPEDDNIEIFSKQQDMSLTMFLDANVDDKYLTKFIRNVEKNVRGNVDYRGWLESLREMPSYAVDAFQYNVTSSDAEIQLHHFPFNLFGITRIITEKMLNEGKRVSTFIVADEVIKLHFEGIIGLVALSVTNHQLAHLGKFTFLRTQINGDWEKFYNRYKDWMDDYEHSIVRKLVETNQIESGDKDLRMIGYDSSKLLDGPSPETREAFNRVEITDDLETFDLEDEFDDDEEVIATKVEVDEDEEFEEDE